MRIRYSPRAREDLEQIRRYIRDTLKNPDAARRVTAGIVADARKLSAQPMLLDTRRDSFLNLGAW